MATEQIIWKTIPFDDRYEISNTGLVKALYRNTIFTSSIKANYFSIKRNKVVKTYIISKLVYDIFTLDEIHINYKYRAVDLENEEWAVFKENDRYAISSKGRVKVISKNLIKVTKIGRWGYEQITLYKNKIRQDYCVHKLVLSAFVPNPENKPMGNHINGIKTDNRVENMEWCTCKENINHAIKTGLRPKNQNRKITEADVVFIRSSNMNAKELSKKYSIQVNHVYKIRRGGVWENI